MIAIDSFDIVGSIYLTMSIGGLTGLVLSEYRRNRTRPQRTKTHRSTR